VPKFATNSERGPGVCASLYGLALVLATSLTIAVPGTRAEANPPEAPADVRAISSNDRAPAIPSEVTGPTVIVKMSDDTPMYQPDSIRIRVGETVEWLNAGGVSHSVVDDPTKADKPDDVALPQGAHTFASGNVMPGGKFRHTFLHPGTYRYFCMSHEIDKMIGEIIVEPPTPSDAAHTASQLHSQPWSIKGIPQRTDDH
jgi:plastocyanin